MYRQVFLAIASTLAVTGVSALSAHSAPPTLDDLSISPRCGLFIHRYGQPNRYIMANNTMHFEISINGQTKKLVQIEPAPSLQRDRPIAHQFRSPDKNIFVKIEGIWGPGYEGYILNSGTLYVSQNQETAQFKVAGYWGC